MAMPAKPAELHALHGTKPEAKSVQSPIVAGRPKYARNLPESLRGLFREVCKQLQERRALTKADTHLISLYCICWDRHQRATKKLLEEGEIAAYTRMDNHGVAHQIEKPNLWFKVAESSEKTMVACLDRLGLSPMNRDKVKPTASSKEEIAQDPMDAFLNRAKRPTVIFSKEQNREQHEARTEAKSAGDAVPTE
jgi:P27 family predicted phage terminase small subunit